MIAAMIALAILEQFSIDLIIKKMLLDNTKRMMYLLIQLIVLLCTKNCILKYNKWNID